MARSSSETRERVAARAARKIRPAAAAELAALLRRRPEDRGLIPGGPAYGAAQLAAALPDDDFDGFVFGTALLVLDRLNGSTAADDLHWNWDAFGPHYRLAEPWRRAALMNGFRLGDAMGQIALRSPPAAADCLTVTRGQILAALIPQSGLDRRVMAAVTADAPAAEAGALWSEAQDNGRALALLPAFRYLAERPAGLAPPDPARAALLPVLI